MSSRYDSWNSEDIDEEILRLDQERETLEQEKSDLQRARSVKHTERRTAYRLRSPASYQTYPQEVYDFASTYGQGSKTEFFRIMRQRYGIAQTEALHLVGARFHPTHTRYTFEPTEVEYETGPSPLELEEIDSRIREINRRMSRIEEEITQLQAEKKRRESSFIEYDIIKYFTYDEPGGVYRHQSPRVRFEVRCSDATIRANKELDDDYIEDKIEPIFDRAFEELGSARVQRTEIPQGRYRDIVRGKVQLASGYYAVQRGGRHYTETSSGGGHWINVESFRKEFSTRGFEPVGTRSSHNPTWHFRIVKYRLPGVDKAGEWSIILNVSEAQVR